SDPSEPFVHVAGSALSRGSSAAAAAGMGGPIGLRRIVALAWRQSVHGPLVRQSRGAAVGDAGISPGLHLGGTGDDQPGARSPKSDSAPGHNTVGAGGHGEGNYSVNSGAGALPGPQGKLAARVGNARRPAANHRVARR